jgi:hypothetical protein
MVEPVFFRLWPVVAWAAMECLVAIWAASSRRPWYWRAIAVWIAVALLAAIEAHDAVWLFSATSLLIVGVLQLPRLTRRRTEDAAEPDSAPLKPHAYRFHLRDVFLLMLLAGMWLMVLVPAAREYQPEKWSGFFVCTAGLAAIAVLSYASIDGRRRWIWRALLAAALPAAVAAVLATDAHEETPGVPELFWVIAPSRMILMTLTFVAGTLPVLIIVVAALARKASTTAQAGRRAVFVGVLLAILLAAYLPSAYVFCWM